MLFKAIKKLIACPEATESLNQQPQDSGPLSSDYPQNCLELTVTER